jgi:hypothetical protein
MVCTREGEDLVLVPVCNFVVDYDFTEPTMPSTWDLGDGFDRSFDS